MLNLGQHKLPFLVLYIQFQTSARFCLNSRINITQGSVATAFYLTKTVHGTDHRYLRVPRQCRQYCCGCRWRHIYRYRLCCIARYWRVIITGFRNTFKILYSGVTNSITTSYLGPVSSHFYNFDNLSAIKITSQLTLCIARCIENRESIQSYSPN